MSKQLMCIVIAKMHIRLNKLIESSNYNLQSNAVQHYSRRLDKVLTHFSKVHESNSIHVLKPLNRVNKYIINI